jgi:hypothetical protein
MLIKDSDKIRSLKDGWDSYGAGPIDVAAIEVAKKLAAVNGVYDIAQIVPCSNGGVQLEWTEQYHGAVLEVEVGVFPKDS